MMDVRAPIAAAAPTLQPRRADPCAFVIFGAGGDLTKRLLVPALYNLMAAQLLPDDFAVIGVARNEMSDEEFRRGMGAALREFATGPLASKAADRLLSRLS